MNESRRTFIKQLGVTTVGAGLLSTLPGDIFSYPLAPYKLPRSLPESQGIASQGILNFLDAIEKSKIEFHSVMVLRHGQVVAEGWWSPYGPGLKHTLYSLSKSFTSTAVGMAIQENHFTLDDPVISFFPDELPSEHSDNLKNMKVRHLLTMSAGHDQDTMGRLRADASGNWIRTFLSLPVELAPGSKFVYNTGATYMLSAIVQSKTGQPLISYLKPRLFDPLGIESPDWETDAKGISTGGFGLRVKTEDIARFGLLYLNKGKWQGKQLIPESWVNEATSAQVQSNPSVVRRPKEQDDWSQGYGFQFWRCRHNAYRGDGAFGQFCIVMPEQDCVVAITGESFDLQSSMNLVWDHVLPAIQASSLKADPSTGKNLTERLKGLSISLPVFSSGSPIVDKISGKQINLDPNDPQVKYLSVTLSGDKCQFNVGTEKREFQINAKLNQWVINDGIKTQDLFPLAGRPVVTTPLAASFGWKDDKTLVISLSYIETAHSDSITLVFEDNSANIVFLNSVSRGNPQSEEKRKAIHGTFS